MTDDPCIHELTPETCSICIHGTSRSRGPELPPETECGCGAGIRWVETSNGKNMPIDADPAEDGAFIIAGRSLTGATLVRFVKPEHRQSETDDRYTSHFATCPDADNYRRR